jgi:hypothetical protein
MSSESSSSIHNHIWTEDEDSLIKKYIKNKKTARTIGPALFGAKAKELKGAISKRVQLLRGQLQAAGDIPIVKRRRTSSPKPSAFSAGVYS